MILDVYMALISFTSCLITIILGKILVPILKKIKFGQTILKIGPSWHQKKQGTPTMGGLTFIFGILFSLALFVPWYFLNSINSGNQILETDLMMIKLLAGLIMALGFAAIGFVDDFIKVKRGKNLGLSAKQKLILQFMVASLFLGTIYMAETFYCGAAKTLINIPFFGILDLDLFYWVFSAIIIVGIVNAVNLNDGVDGLCGSVSMTVAFGFIIISKIFNMQGMGFISSAMFGSCLGFLFWNFHPAKVFMGDTGSLFLGGLICALGYIFGSIPLLILFAMTYILEMFSVILQVLYFKISKGKRLFKMSPIHHHFEMIGFSEKKICVIFSLATLFFISVGILLLAINQI